MTVRRIVADIETTSPKAAAGFYGDVLGLIKLMDSGFIETWGVSHESPVQISFASEGGSGTPCPDLSIEVDDLHATLAKARSSGFEVIYGPVREPWGVERFFVRDPFGNVINILSHEG